MRLSLILVVTTCVVSGGVAYVMGAEVYDEVLHQVSCALHRARTDPSTDPLVMKSAFSETPTPNVKAVVNHTHGIAAANRSAASFLIDLLGRSVARTVWFYQRSGADVRSGRAGSRTYFWVKDLATAPERCSPPADSLLAMVDVDQYVDMPNLLVDQFKPVLIYTFQPSAVSRDTGDYNFTFDECSNVDYHVAGGGKYTGQVWNYDGDSLKVRKTLFGITYALATYHVERRFMDPDHQLILLAPSAYFRGFGAMLADFFLEGPELKRLNLFQGGHLRLRSMTPSGMCVSTGKPSGFLSCTVPAAVDEAIASVARTTKSGLTLPMVKTRMGDEWKGAEILYEFHKTSSVRTMDKVSVTAEHVRTFQYFDSNDLDEFAKPTMVPFMAPIVDGAFAPAATVNNDLRAVTKRIWEQENNTVITPHVVKVVDEFVTLMLGDNEGTLHPVDDDFVKEKQNRPSQRRILEEAEFLEAHPLAKTFIKKEAYQAVTDPRIISTIDGVTKRHYSMYTYALAEVVKTAPWYSFSKSPREVAERVAEICTAATTSATKSDFTRMDGRISEILRYLEKILMVRAFRPEYRDDIVKQMGTQHNIKAVTSNGLKYVSKLARLSGSPETSLFNTVANAFITFMTFRAMRRPDGTFYSAAEAYAALGIYGGDDGLTADIDVRKYAKTAWTCGQKLEAEPVARGSFGVDFLSRVYGPDVWHGDTNSCCSVYRTLSKFHVTTHLPGNITALEKLNDKAAALSLTDANTPIVGDFVRKAAFKPLDEFHNLCGAWNVAEASVQYPNERAEWMEEYVTSQLPYFNQEKFLDFMETASTTDLLEMPYFTDRPEPKIKPGRVVVDGDVVDTRPVPTPDETEQRQLRTRPGDKKKIKLRAEKPQVTA